MKIKPEHYAVILDALKRLGGKIEKHREFLRSDARVKDLEMRLRWDAAYATGLTRWFCEHIYSYANDEHIDTALRAAMKEIEG